MELPSESTQNSLTEESFKDLSEKDRAFGVEYITNGFNHREAAKSVGLSPDTGISKLRQPLVSDFIRYLQERSASVNLITKQFVEQKYLEVLPKLMGEESVSIFDHKEGISIEAKKFHSAEVVSVLRDLGKAAGYVAPEGPKGGNVNVQINMGGFVGATDPEVIIEHDDE